jgi:hypothetical protein
MDETTQPYLSGRHQPDGGESQVFCSALVSVAAWPRLEVLIALQPAEVLDVLQAFRVKAASSGISLQHTQQLVAVGSFAFMVAPSID